MLQVTYRLTLGRDEFELKADVKSEKEFFEIMSFYSNLPRTAPGGADDLKIVFRSTKEGHKYYSLVSEKEKLEFRFGQNLEKNGNGLFPKGWQKLYEATDSEEATTGAAVQYGQAAAPAAQNANYPGMVNPVIGPSATQQVAAPVTPSTIPSTQPAVAASQNVAQRSQQATNVLARFGINS